MTYTPTGDAQSRVEGGQHIAGQHGDVRAERVEITQGGANNIDAQSVSISQGGAARVRANELTISQGGVAVARTRRLTLGQNASAFAVMAEQATVEGPSNILLLVARNTSGNVRPLLDWRVAAAFGAGLGLVLAVFRRR